MANDPYKYFRIEVREILDELGNGVLGLEKGQALPDLVGRLLRLAHTLKGAARVVKQREIAEHAHAIEDVLSPFRDGTTAVAREQIDVILEHLDAISVRAAALAPPPEQAVAGVRAPLAEEPLPTLHAGTDEMDALLDGVAEVSVQLAAVRRVTGSLERARQLAGLVADKVVAQKAPGFDNGATARMRSMTEELHDLVSRVDRDLIACLDQTERELYQVREAAERLRLLPARLMFNSLERAARDVAVSLGKQITFETRGGDVRLDTEMLGTIQRALIQAVRNAVAHGIESQKQRVSQGKPAAGRLALEVVRRGNRISFACQDDGAGVDLEAVRRAAERAGLLAADAPDTSSDNLLRLLLQGGLSTSGRITEVSGRGIGLDVVRDTTSRLGGATTLRSKAGQGTVLEIVVPMSLASLDALVVEAGGQTAAIPLDSVRHTLRLASADVTHTAEGDSIFLGGNIIPFVSLASAFRRGPAASSARRAWSAVIVESQGAAAAIGVDRLVGTENVVVRPLPDFTPADPGVAGASLDAEGNPRLVLDPDGLVAEACKRGRTPRVAPPVPPPILVVDDSLTTRMLEQSILESAGYDVDVATSGEDGFAKARARRYGLFLVDVEMPGMDGFTFIEQSRVDPLLSHIPAILVTSRASPEDRARGRAVGASAYIAKSEFDQADLLARIRRLVG